MVLMVITPAVDAIIVHKDLCEICTSCRCCNECTSASHQITRATRLESKYLHRTGYGTLLQSLLAATAVAFCCVRLLRHYHSLWLQHQHIWYCRACRGSSSRHSCKNIMHAIIHCDISKRTACIASHRAELAVCSPVNEHNLYYCSQIHHYDWSLIFSSIQSALIAARNPLTQAQQLHCYNDFCSQVQRWCLRGGVSGRPVQ